VFSHFGDFLAYFAACRPDETWYALWESWNFVHATDGWSYEPQIITSRSPAENEQHRKDVIASNPTFSESLISQGYNLNFPKSDEEYRRYVAKKLAGFANFRRDVKQALRRVWDPCGIETPPLTNRPIGWPREHEMPPDYIPPWDREEKSALERKPSER
jgi:hypothetical protein